MIVRGNLCRAATMRSSLLITRLGLRGIDVKRLEFCDFDWPGDRLSVVQAKTGHRVRLPLLKTSAGRSSTIFVFDAVRGEAGQGVVGVGHAEG